MVTVLALIKELQKLPQDLKVVYDVTGPAGVRVEGEISGVQREGSGVVIYD